MCSGAVAPEHSDVLAGKVSNVLAPWYVKPVYQLSRCSILPIKL
jgi:hypothetical protein